MLNPQEYMWTLHPASTSSETATRFWGMSLTKNARFAVFGKFLSLSNKLFVVWIGTCDGVLREMFGSWTGATSHSASFPRMDVDAAQSR